MAAFEHALVLLLLIASLSVITRWLPWPPLITYLLGGLYFGESLGQIGIFAIFIAVLLLRPQGLFGARA